MKQTKLLSEYSRFDAIGLSILNGSNRPTAGNYKKAGTQASQNP
ncbi:hypothetical protein [Methylomonas fluvii]|nr:hypothetical protein [Methylomonas fluvii]